MEMRIAGQTLSQFRRAQPAYRRTERWGVWDVVHGSWLAQRNEVIRFDEAQVRQLAQSLELADPDRPLQEGGLLRVRRTLAEDYQVYLDRIDLERPILFATFVGDDGAPCTCLIDGQHRVHKAYRVSSPLMGVVLTASQTSHITLPAEALRW